MALSSECHNEPKNFNFKSNDRQSIKCDEMTKNISLDITGL